MAPSYRDHHQTNGQKKSQVVVVMVPFPAQGHLNQLLHLSRLISSYDIPVHYVGTTTHSRQAKSRVHGWDLLSSTNIHFHEFSTPSFITPPPNPNASIKFPIHLLPSWESSMHLREPVGALIQTLALTAHRVIVIYDSIMVSVVQDVVNIEKAEAYDFQSLSAFFISSYRWEAMGKPSVFQDEMPKDLPSMDACFSPEFREFINVKSKSVPQFSSGTIHDVSRVIEDKYFDLLQKEDFAVSAGNKKQWALGPFNPVSVSDHNSSNERHKCLKWLDKQALNSVIFVSFGSTTSLSDEQIHEIAIGLENSGQKFIWVLRDADKGDIFEGDVRRAELPKGYEERIQGKGMILRDWAPQLEILAHQSTGGFMSHCGWNSCMESISMGVPMAAWPMHSDQPRNALLVTEILKTGTEVKDWARRDELVTSLSVQKAVTILLASKEGDVMKKRAAELSGAVKRSVAEGGVTRAELDAFITHITRM